MTTTCVSPAGLACADDQRRAHILDHPRLNGIESVEFERRPGPEYVLVVRLLKPVPDVPHSDPDGAYDLTNHPEWVHVEGGSRIVGIEALEIRRAGDHLEIFLSAEGDFSTYFLLLGWERGPDGAWRLMAPNLDRQLSRTAVYFKAGCPVDFDCRDLEACPPPERTEPNIDYLAKDYASFRRLLLDLIPQRNPGWLERSPADLGIALIELLAYEGDQLSYFQDAVANEAFLDTARQRVSAKRHARLVDYRMHDGRNAWTFVQVEASGTGTLPMGTRLLTKINTPLRYQAVVPGTIIPEVQLGADGFETDPALRDVLTFETTFDLRMRPENNEIQLHAWGDLECCLPAAVTSAYLYRVTPAGGGIEIANRPVLERGDFLLIEEVKGPLTGDAADADPTHRQVVLITSVDDPTTDEAYSDRLLNGRPQVWAAGDAELPLLRVTWRRVQGDAFPICLSARIPGEAPLLGVTVARGNMVAADHGRTVTEQVVTPPVPPDSAFQLRLSKGPLTMQCQPDRVQYDPTMQRLMTTPRSQLDCPVRDTMPAVALQVTLPFGTLPWVPVPDLLDSSNFAQEFVADIGNDGRAVLRFGDGEYGREVAGATGFSVIYRIGSGRAGNIGAEALSHAVLPTPFPPIRALRNPLPARDGTDPETIEETRQFAPAAFRAEQFRAVTEQDYADAARKLPEVAGAVANFRWTGSWYTVYVGIDPRSDEDLVLAPGGRTELAPGLAALVQTFLLRYKLAGYDLDIRAAEYVPLEIELDLCVCPSHFRGDVSEAVRRALSSQVNPDGSRGFFHAANFTFGQPVYLSRLYAALEAVQGVDSASVTTFRRFGKPDDGELERGVIEPGRWEIARLSNDPSLMENGVIRINARGGK